ncbi:MAG: DUF4242 domain-containing protein [Gammaproteobacteria bacterium]|jgi:hypothetical protein
MSEVFVERTFDPAITDTDVYAMAHDGGGCMNLYQVDWQESFLAVGGQRMVCHFRAPDAESVRTAFRQVGADASVVWPATLHDAPDPPSEPPNVLVERSFDHPVALEDIQAIEDTAATCLETHRVHFVRTFFSRDRKRMLCLYRAPDAESVRLAQREAEMPFDRVWAFQRIDPASSA